MVGPALSPREIAAVIGGRVAHFENLGFPRALAIEIAAREYGLAAHRVGWLLDQHRAGEVI
jgi:hypothetical protein